MKAAVRLAGIALGLCGALAAGARAQTLPTRPAAEISPQRLAAYRAARAEAARGLIEQVRAIALSRNATVGDFLSADPRLEMALAGWLLAGADPAPATLADTLAQDGSLEATAAAAPGELANALRYIHKNYYRGERFRTETFDAVASAPARTIRQSARARPSPLLRERPLVEGGTRQDFPGGMDPAAARYWGEHVTDAGRLSAEQAAREDAARRLIRQVRRLPVDEETSLGAFAGDKTDLEPLLRGMRLLGLRYEAGVPVVEAEVEIEVKTVYAALKSWVQVRRPGEPGQVRLLEERIVAAEGSLRQTGVGCPQAGQLKRLSAPALAAIALAASPPEWVGGSLRATGGGRPAARPETTSARATTGPSEAGAQGAGEREARASLAAAVAELKVTEGLTVGHLAREDPALRAALLAHLQSATSAGEKSAGGFVVTMELPLQPIWRAVLRGLTQPPPPAEKPAPP